MNKYIHSFLILALLLIFSGCVNYEKDDDMSLESSSNVNYIKGIVKKINKESFVVETSEDLRASMDSTDKDILKNSEIFIFMPFEESKNILLNQLKINDSVSIGYSNIAITNGVYVMTLIEVSQLSIL